VTSKETAEFRALGTGLWNPDDGFRGEPGHGECDAALARTGAIGTSIWTLFLDFRGGRIASPEYRA